MRSVKSLLLSGVLLVGVATSGEVSAADICAADSAWFDGETLNVSEPPDPTNNDCGFYQRAWQAFLSVTKVDSKTTRPRFVDFENIDSVFGSPTPAGLKSAFAFTAKSPGRLSVGLRLVKEQGPIFHEGIEQADSSILVDQQGHPIFYAIHMDPVFTDFVRSNGLNNRDTLRTADKDLPIKVGAIEMKSAWKVVDSNSPLGDFITADANIPSLAQNGAGIVADLQNTRPAKLALLGLHVVFALENHPELIWATFEHVSNGEFDLAPRAPDLPGSYDITQPVNSGTNFILYQANVTGAAAGTAPISLTLDLPSQTISPTTSVYRRFPWSQQLDPKHPDDAKSEDDMVQSVNAEIGKGFVSRGSNDPRSHYKLVGAVWVANGAVDVKAGVKIKDDKLEGENGLSNMAMESFTQGNNPNCFGCHQPMSSGGLSPKRINVSHIFSKFFQSGSH
jgi:hypothetical protein